MLRRSLFVGVLVFLSGCSNPQDSTEYKQLEARVKALNAAVSSLQKVMDEEDELKSRFRELQTVHSGQIREFGKRIATSQQRQAVISTFVEPACKSWVNARYSLLARMDEDDVDFEQTVASRLGVKTMFWKDILEDYPALKSEVDWDSCHVEFLREWILRECISVDVTRLKRTPDSYRGKCLKGTLKVVQADSATGPCMFHGNISGSFDSRVQFGSTHRVSSQSAITECSDSIKNVYEGQSLFFVGYGVGEVTYTTALNSMTSIPAVKLLGVD